MADDTRSGGVPLVSGADVRTFLFADMRGYTRFTQEHGDEATAHLAAQFAELVGEVVSTFEGELLELRGDEALCVFRSARQALRTSVELQRRLRTHTDTLPPFPLGVGMGLDAGEAVPTQGGYRGAALNVAARLCAIAGPGQILASESAVHLAGRMDGLRFEHRRSVRLKGIEDPVRLVEVAGDRPLPPVPDTLPRAPRHRRLPRRRFVMAIVALVAAAATAVFGLAENRSGATLVVRHDALLALAGDGHARTVGPLGMAPTGVAVGGGWIWVTNRDDGTVSGIRLDGHEREIIPVGTAPTAIAYDRGALWVTDSASAAVYRVSTAIRRVVGRFAVGNGPQGVAVSAGRVWVSNSLDATVSEIDPADERVRQIRVGPDPTAIVADQGDVWVADTSSDTVSRIDARTGEALQPVTVGDAPDALAAHGASLWVANGGGGSVTRIDARRATAPETIPAGLDPSAIAVSGGAVWVSDSRGGLIGLHPSAPARRTRAWVAGTALALAGTSSGLWVAAAPPLTGHRGGTLRALIGGPLPDPLDPAINYNVVGWQALGLTNDGLTAFRHVNGPQGETVVPDLAVAIPQPGDQGLTYTFEVRRGIRYSTGTPVRPADVRTELERVFDAGVGDGLYGDIVGAAACARRPPPVRCDLNRGITVDNAAGTVTFHLTRPDADFPAKLALPFAAAVPATARTPPHCDDSRTLTCGYARQPAPLPATGPYMIVPTGLRFSGAGELELVRNPEFHEWSVAAQPSGYPDRIVWRFGGSSAEEAAAIARGKADWTMDIPPAETLARLAASRPHQVHRNPSLSIAALTFDVRRPPFSRAAARRAVSYALNRVALTRIGSGGISSRPTCQILPSGILGYAPYCPYTERVPGTRAGAWAAPDRGRARRLVRRSGTSGARVTIALQPEGEFSPAPDRAGVRRFAAQLTSALQGIGYRPHVVQQASANPPADAEIAFTYWIEDYPYPSDFLPLLFGCSATRTGDSTNLSAGGFCDPGLDREMARALRTQATDPTRAAAAWARADREVTNAAPWVPLFTADNVDLLSRRVGNYEYSPQLLVLLDQLWVR